MDFLDAIQAGEGESDAAANRDTSADVTMAGAAGCDGEAVTVGELEQDGDGLGGTGEGDGVG
jgi:hypothetical protein